MVASSTFAAVLLSDIVSSTQLRIRLGAGFTRLLREHDELVTRVLDGHGALTQEDTGDGFLATFDSTTAALQAACALQWAVVERNAAVALDQRFQIRVVLAAGELYGRPDKRSGLALVDVARLENATEADEVRCTEVFRLLAGEQAPGLFVGAQDVAFQGIDDPRRVWQVDWRAAPPFPAELPLPAPLSGPPDELFVGREAELAQLERVWATVSHSGNRLVLVRGGAGMGKSTLARRFARTVHARHGWVLHGRCDPEARVAFQPFAEALGTFVAATGGSRQLLGRFPDRLARLLGDRGSVRDRGPDPGPDGRAAASVGADQEADRFELFEAVADWLALISAPEPVLLVVDDLNWADRATLDLLRHVVRAGHLGSVCILATYRTVEEDQSPAFRTGLPELQHLDRELEVLTLGGLSDDQVRRALAHRLGDPAAAGLDAVEVFAQDLRTYTSGNPLFVGAILGELSGEVLAGLLDGSLRPGALGGLDVPSDVLALFRGRYERLDPAAQRLLDIACLIGPTFEQDVAARAAGCGAAEAAAAVEALERAGFLRPRQGAVTEFSHAVIREAALRNLEATEGSATAVRDLHLAIARAVEASRDPHAAAAELSHHLGFSDDAGDVRAAAGHAVVAGDRALGSLQPAMAARHYRRALELFDRLDAPLSPAERCDLEAKLGVALRSAGDPDATTHLLAAFRAARELGDPQRMARTALATGTDMWSDTGSVDATKVAVLSEALGAPGLDDAGLRARLLAGLATELTFSGEAERRTRLIEEAVELARRVWQVGGRPADAAVLARVLANLNVVLLDPASLARRREVIAELDGLSAVCGPGREFTTASFGLWTAVEAGDVASCRRRLRLMRELTDAVGHPRMRAVTQHWGSSMAALSGQLDDAERLASESYELFLSLGSPDALVFNVGLRYLAAWFRGQFKELVDDLEACSDAHPGRVGMRAGLAHAWSALGDLDRSAAMLATIDLDHLDAHQDQLPTLAMVTMAAAATGDVERCGAARRLLEPFGDHFVFNGTACFGSAWHYVALAATAAGDHEDADRWFQVASSAHTELSAPALLALTKLEWAKALLRRRGPSDDIRARVLLEDVLTIAHGLRLAVLEAESHRMLAGGIG